MFFDVFFVNPATVDLFEYWLTACKLFIRGWLVVVVLLFIVLVVV